MSPRKPATSRSKKDQARSSCPIASTLDIVGDKWTLLVVRDLSLGCKRYGDFLSSPEGYPTNILADRLKRLEAVDLIERVLYSKRPPRAEYFLTDKGRSLLPLLAQLSAWGLEHIAGSQVWERPVAPEETEAPESQVPEMAVSAPSATAAESEVTTVPHATPVATPEPEVVYAEEATAVPFEHDNGHDNSLHESHESEDSDVSFAGNGHENGNGHNDAGAFEERAIILADDEEPILGEAISDDVTADDSDLDEAVDVAPADSTADEEPAAPSKGEPTSERARTDQMSLW